MTGKSFLIIIAFISLGSAQDLVTDRPDFTESALSVPNRMVQIESGAEYSRGNSVTNFSYPAMLARIGIGYNVEVRVGFSGWLYEKTPVTSGNYFNDMILEGKYQITSSEATVPMALLLVSTLPTRNDAVTVDKTEFGLKYAGSYDFNEKLGVGVNVGAISSDVGGSRTLTSLASVALGIGINEKLSAFVETFAEFPENGEWQPVVDGGFTWLFTPVAQADLYFGRGLNNNTDLIIGFGFSYRFKY